MSFDIFTIVLIFCIGFCTGMSFIALCIDHLNRERYSPEEGDDWHD